MTTIPTIITVLSKYLTSDDKKPSKHILDFLGMRRNYIDNNQGWFPLRGRDDFSYAGYYDFNDKFHLYGITKDEEGFFTLYRSFMNYLWKKLPIEMDQGLICPYQSNTCLLSYNPNKPIGCKLMFCIRNSEADKIM